MSDRKENIKFVSDRVVGVIGPESTGTGFVIENGGKIITCNHVIEPARENEKLEIFFGDPSRHIPYHVKAINSKYDLALLFPTTEVKLDKIKSGDSELVEVGDEIAFSGYPFGKGIWGDFVLTTHRGMISAVKRFHTDFGEYDFFQIDAMANEGNSGGPVFLLETGEVIGMICNVVRWTVEDLLSIKRGVLELMANVYVPLTTSAIQDALDRPSEEGVIKKVIVPPQQLDIKPSNEEERLLQRSTGIAQLISINLILKWIGKIG
jgi:serine protease Do